MINEIKNQLDNEQLETAPELFIVTFSLPPKIFYFLQDLCQLCDISLDQWIQNNLNLILNSYADGFLDCFNEEIHNYLQKIMKEFPLEKT